MRIDIILIKILCVFIILVTTLAAPMRVQDELMSIVSGLLNQSALLEPWKEKDMLYRAAEKIYMIRKRNTATAPNTPP